MEDGSVHFLGDSKFAKFDFSEMDSGFFGDDITPEKRPANNETHGAKRKVVTFSKDTPDQFPKKPRDNENLFGGENCLFSDTPKKIDNDYLKKTSQSASQGTSESKCDNISSPILCVVEGLDHKTSMEDYFKGLIGEATEDICKKVLPGLLEIERFEKECSSRLDDILKDAKKYEANLIKENMALKKRVERLMDTFNK